ncbi:hypothetical protein EVAR_54516_1 [Eumeta japonica]|uniref:Uncharacterized protein n=1 Tax=Eumeta variegata TaxID=151549 RepID=A0A4C1YJH5_EUMVA|nr:hypothetical protein EVAR_54516_1 [Eumeta japonica]
MISMNKSQYSCLEHELRARYARRSGRAVAGACVAPTAAARTIETLSCRGRRRRPRRPARVSCPLARTSTPRAHRLLRSRNTTRQLVGQSNVSVDPTHAIPDTSKS